MNAKDSAAFRREAAAAGVKPTSIPWMVHALDPFHDTDADIGGSPDPSNGHSVVYTVREKVSISRPSALAADANWDCHIAALPVVQDQWDPCTIAGLENIVGIASGSAPNQLVNASFIQAHAAAAGTDTFNASVPSTSNGGPAQEIHGIAMSDFFKAANGRARVISGGFQVVNTTSKLNLQGEVLCYEQMNHGTPLVHAARPKQDGASNLAMVPVSFFRGPPRNVDEARQLPSVAWSADEGAYVRFKIDHLRNPELAYGCCNAVLHAEDGTGATTYGWCPQGLCSGWQSGSPNTVNGQMLPFVQTGAYFTGLSYETTLSIELIVHIEMFPFPGSPLIALASPSCPADARALEAVDEIQRDQLPGVMLKYNSAGTLFRGVLNSLRSWVTDKGPHGAASYARGAGALLSLHPQGARLTSSVQNGMTNAAELRQAVLEGNSRQAAAAGRALAQQARSLQKGKAKKR